MSRLDTRASSIPPQHSAAMSKTDDSASSVTPGTASDNSVAYQYVAVQQMTSCRDHIEYQLTVREQPKQSRMCGVGEKADRRPIDPAPIVQLRVITHDRPVRQNHTVDSASVAPPVERRPGHGPKLPNTPGVRSGMPVTTALGDGWEDKAWYLENPYFFMYAMLCNADTDEELHLLNDGKTRYTSGSCVSCLYHLKDIDGSHQGFFVFPDLSIRVEGRYRLKLCLFETIGHSVHHCKSIYSDPFHVYTAKRFPGMEESTKLSKSFAEQGLKVRVRKHPRSRRRASKRTKEESDASDDDTALSRDRSPKRARASDMLPTSGLPMPQPLASRMPRSLDPRFQRIDYDRNPPIAASPHDLTNPPPGRHAAWEQDEAMRLRHARSRDQPLDQGLYARHVRDDRALERPSTSREYVQARYLEDYPPRNRPASSHASMFARRPSEYAEYGAPAYLRDDPARSLHPPPTHPAATPPHSSHSSHPSLPGRGHPESLLNLAAPHSRNYALAAAPMPSHPPRLHSRPYAPSDHAVHEPVRTYDEYGVPPRHGARYSAPYDQRDLGAARLSPSPPPPGSVDYSGRATLAPLTPSQWRPRARSPHLACGYRSGAADREFAARRTPPPPPPPLRRIATPPATFLGETNVYHRRGYAPSESARSAAAAYELEAAAPGASRVALVHAGMPPPMDAYARDDGLRPRDLAPERVGSGMLAGRERPMLPPLSASPSLAHGERDREDVYAAIPRDRESGYGPNERYLTPSGYLSRGAPLSDAEVERERELEWERERMAVRQYASPASLREDVYAARDWEPRTAPRPGGGATRPF